MNSNQNTAENNPDNEISGVKPLPDAAAENKEESGVRIIPLANSVDMSRYYRLEDGNVVSAQEFQAIQAEKAAALIARALIEAEEAAEQEEENLPFAHTMNPKLNFDFLSSDQLIAWQKLLEGHVYVNMSDAGPQLKTEYSSAKGNILTINAVRQLHGEEMVATLEKILETADAQDPYDSTPIIEISRMAELNPQSDDEEPKSDVLETAAGKYDSTPEIEIGNSSYQEIVPPTVEITDAEVAEDPEIGRPTNPQISLIGDNVDPEEDISTMPAAADAKPNFEAEPQVELIHSVSSDSTDGNSADSDGEIDRVFRDLEDSDKPIESATDSEVESLPMSSNGQAHRRDALTVDSVPPMLSSRLDAEHRQHDSEWQLEGESPESGSIVVDFLFEGDRVIPFKQERSLEAGGDNRTYFEFMDQLQDSRNSRKRELPIHRKLYNAFRYFADGALHAVENFGCAPKYTDFQGKTILYHSRAELYRKLCKAPQQARLAIVNQQEDLEVNIESFGVTKQIRYMCGAPDRLMDILPKHIEKDVRERYEYFDDAFNFVDSEQLNKGPKSEREDVLYSGEEYAKETVLSFAAEDYDRAIERVDSTEKSPQYLQQIANLEKRPYIFVKKQVQSAGEWVANGIKSVGNSIGSVFSATWNKLFGAKATKQKVKKTKQARKNTKFNPALWIYNGVSAIGEGMIYAANGLASLFKRKQNAKKQGKFKQMMNRKVEIPIPAFLRSKKDSKRVVSAKNNSKWSRNIAYGLGVSALAGLGTYGVYSLWNKSEDDTYNQVIALMAQNSIADQGDDQNKAVPDNSPPPAPEITKPKPKLSAEEPTQKKVAQEAGDQSNDKTVLPKQDESAQGAKSVQNTTKKTQDFSVSKQAKVDSSKSKPAYKSPTAVETSPEVKEAQPEIKTPEEEKTQESVSPKTVAFYKKTMLERTSQISGQLDQLKAVQTDNGKATVWKADSDRIHQLAKKLRKFDGNTEQMESKDQVMTALTQFAVLNAEYEELKADHEKAEKNWQSIKASIGQAMIQVDGLKADFAKVKSSFPRRYRKGDFTITYKNELSDDGKSTNSIERSFNLGQLDGQVSRIDKLMKKYKDQGEYAEMTPTDAEEIANYARYLRLTVNNLSWYGDNFRSAKRDGLVDR